MNFLFVILSLLHFSDQDFKPSISVVTQTVQDFAKFGDERDVEKMSKLLHDEYRSIVNQAFGSADIQFISKSAYLGLLKAGKIGGDKRSVTIKSVHLQENNALVLVELKGSKFIFHSYLQLLRDNAGDWKIISDMPYIEKVD